MIELGTRRSNAMVEKPISNPIVGLLADVAHVVGGLSMLVISANKAEVSE